MSVYNGIYYSYCPTYISAILIERSKWQKFTPWESEDLQVHAKEDAGVVDTGTWGRRSSLLCLFFPAD